MQNNTNTDTQIQMLHTQNTKTTNNTKNITQKINQIQKKTRQI